MTWSVLQDIPEAVKIDFVNEHAKVRLTETRPLRMEIKELYRGYLLDLAVGWHTCASR